jgi:hypothetical protein
LLRTNLLQQAQRFDLYDPELELHRTKEFEDLICYLSISRMTTKQTKFLKISRKATEGSKRSCISLLDDILSGYSHSKMEDLMKDDCFKAVFQYFVYHLLEDFISKLELKKQTLFRDSIRQI